MSLKLVLHHPYNHGRATDVSGANHHGQVAHATQGTGAFSSALQFFMTSRVSVPSSPELADLGALRVKVRCMWTPSSLTFDRFNGLVVGNGSFMLGLLPGGVLVGSVSDASGNMKPLKAPGGFHANQWHDVELWHDGVSTAQVRVDGQVVAIAYDIVGPVRGIGPLGIGIGHSLDPNQHLATFHGWIDDVQLAKREIDPVRPLDPACTDLRTIDDIVDGARAGGLTGDKAREILARLVALEGGMRAQVVDGDGLRAQRLEDLLDQGAVALQSGDAQVALDHVLTGASFMRERVTDADIEAFARAGLDIMAEAPYGDVIRQIVLEQRVDLLAPLAAELAALCFPDPQPEPDPGPILLRTSADRDTDGGPPLAPPRRHR